MTPRRRLLPQPAAGAHHAAQAGAGAQAAGAAARGGAPGAAGCHLCAGCHAPGPAVRWAQRRACGHGHLWRRLRAAGEGVERRLNVCRPEAYWFVCRWLCKPAHSWLQACLHLTSTRHALVPQLRVARQGAPARLPCDRPALPSGLVGRWLNLASSLPPGAGHPADHGSHVQGAFPSGGVAAGSHGGAGALPPPVPTAGAVHPGACASMLPRQADWRRQL